MNYNIIRDRDESVSKMAKLVKRFDHERSRQQPLLIYLKKIGPMGLGRAFMDGAGHGFSGVAILPHGYIDNSFMGSFNAKRDQDYQPEAHELGHLFGLFHSSDSRLMGGQPILGTTLNEDDCEKFRASRHSKRLGMPDHKFWDERITQQ